MTADVLPTPLLSTSHMLPALVTLLDHTSSSKLSLATQATSISLLCASTGLQAPPYLSLGPARILSPLQPGASLHTCKKTTPNRLELRRGGLAFRGVCSDPGMSELKESLKVISFYLQ